MSPLRVAVIGCTGRMGRALLRLIAADTELRLAAAVTLPGDPLAGQDAGTIAGVPALGVRVSASVESAVDAAIEFSTPAACAEWAAWCATHGTALVSGTTGLDPAARGALERAATKVPVLWAANMSIGVNLLLKLAAEAAAQTGAGWDIEIVEAHHRHKVDAPSGTAKALLDAVAAARGLPAESALHGRSGLCGPRGQGEIAVHAVRMGEIVGEHDVHFASAAEVLTLSHRALSRDTFAAGALRAAKWLSERPAGMYSMRDLLEVG